MEQEVFQEENTHWSEKFVATVRQSLILENHYVENIASSIIDKLVLLFQTLNLDLMGNQIEYEQKIQYSPRRSYRKRKQISYGKYFHIFQLHQCQIGCNPIIIFLGPKIQSRNYRQKYAQDYQVLPGILDYYDGIIWNQHLSYLS